MEWIEAIMAGQTAPWLTVCLLGLVNAVSHCLLASNIAALCYISQDIDRPRRVFLHGVFYTLGRTVTYTLLAWLVVMILKRGADLDSISHFISHYGEKIMGPLLILIGIIVFFSHKLNFRMFNFSFQSYLERQRTNHYAGSFMIGLILALAFCPTSAFIFFGVLIPLSTASADGYFFPLLFAVSSGLPVILIAWILAFNYARIHSIYNRMQVSGDWFRISLSILFILFGLYYLFGHEHLHHH